MGRPAIDLTGRRFGRLKVMARTAGYPIKWECLCDCGNVCTPLGELLKRGTQVSCGCYRRDRMRAQVLQHGESNSITWRSWRSMRARCLNPTADQYDNYGGRGISICDRWESFAAFLEDMGPRPSRAHTLDRVDPNGDYGPGNCRWATPTMQSNNRRRNVRLSFEGRTQTMAEWSRELGFPPNLIGKRLRAGWTVDRCLRTAKGASSCHK